MKARFVCLAGGILHRPKLPGIPDINVYKGHSFHTSRWDYEYTGGDTNGGLTNLRGKRVGIIGTGATAIQCVPHLAQYADELYVFQRTPSTVDERNNKPTDPTWAAALEQGWQKKRRENFTSIVLGIPQDEDLVNDRWTDVWGKLWSMPANMAPDVDPAEVMQMADYMKMNEIRGRIDSIVTNKQAAESLKPWYNLFCKRPGYSDEFLQVFNQPNVHLIDTQGQGVDRITEKGIVSQGTEYEVDCIIYATGFNTVLPPFLAGDYEVIGRDSRTLGDHWAEEVKSVHGLMTRGFPNLFIHGHTWGATLTVNVPHALGEQSAHVAAIVARCLQDGVRTAEVSPAAEDAWQETILANQIDRTKFLSECTPGYFNDEGQKKGPMHRTFGGEPDPVHGAAREVASRAHGAGSRAPPTSDTRVAAAPAGRNSMACGRGFRPAPFEQLAVGIVRSRETDGMPIASCQPPSFTTVWKSRVSRRAGAEPPAQPCRTRRGLTPRHKQGRLLLVHAPTNVEGAPWCPVTGSLVAVALYSVQIRAIPTSLVPVGESNAARAPEQPVEIVAVGSPRRRGAVAARTDFDGAGGPALAALRRQP